MNTTTESTSPTKRQARFPFELLKSSAFLLKRLGFWGKEQGMAAYEDAGFSPYHHAILVALDEDSHETQGSIADALGYDRGQMVGLLDELEDRGLVERRRDPDDRRRQIVSMTAEGRKALTKLRALSKRLDDEMLSPLDAEERAQLHALLLRLARHHLPACPGPPPVVG